MTYSFLPTTLSEVNERGWNELDVILVTGDSYIDSPFIGAAMIGRVLENRGFRVGIIAQPDINTSNDITRLGSPRLFWGVTGGSVDSMLANYTASKRKRRSDDYTPGGINNRRPDRAVIVYSNLIRRFFKPSPPIVLGGIEASLRRIAHYDYWSNSIRRSVLFDAKADYLLYGMAEKSVLELAEFIRDNQPVHDIKGLCTISQSSRVDYLTLPSYEQVSDNHESFSAMFHDFYKNCDPLSARGLQQAHGDRWLIHNPPSEYPSQHELDMYYAFPFSRQVHPFYEKFGKVKALETIQFSINTHHGCYGECNFCSISVHEGRTVRWRSQQSILNEAVSITHLPNFKGYILDVGGPTANMYGYECPIKLKKGACLDKRCIYPQICNALKPDHSRQLELLTKLKKIPGVKKVFVGSGLRYDLLEADSKCGDAYLEAIVRDHVSGQLKVAPEHSQDHVLGLMGKANIEGLSLFKKKFDMLTNKLGKRQYLTYYFIAAHPGCTEKDMHELRQFIIKKLHLIPEQVQLFIPLPSTYSALMYFTGKNPFTGEKIFVEKDPARRDIQKNIITKKISRLT